MDFYPDGALPPEELVTPEFLLRPLRASDVDLDYEAVMESRLMLRESSGGTWPTDDFSLAENLADLAIHEKEHLEGVAFTYTMMNLAQSECLGCVYVNRLSPMYQIVSTTGSKPIDDRSAIVRFWVRQSRLDTDLEWQLLSAMFVWFQKEWPVGQVFFRANERDRRQQSLMLRAGLPLSATLELNGRTGPFLAYGPIGASSNRGTT